MTPDSPCHTFTRSRAPTLACIDTHISLCPDIYTHTNLPKTRTVLCYLILLKFYKLFFLSFTYIFKLFSFAWIEILLKQFSICEQIRCTCWGRMSVNTVLNWAFGGPRVDKFYQLFRKIISVSLFYFKISP